MKTRFITFLLLFVMNLGAFAQSPYQPAEENLKARLEFQDNKFGIFLHWGLANFGETNVQPDENYQNSCGEYVDAYVQAVKEAGNVWGVPVIDFNAVTGLNPMVEEQLIYFYDAGYDRLHPSTKGQIRMARTLMYQLLALPATF